MLYTCVLQMSVLFLIKSSITYQKSMSHLKNVECRTMLMHKILVNFFFFSFQRKIYGCLHDWILMLYFCWLTVIIPWG